MNVVFYSEFVRKSEFRRKDDYSAEPRKMSKNVITLLQHRTIHRLYRYSSHDDRRRVFKRWLTFKNIYMLSTDLVFLIALILRYYAYLNSQCRRGCPYQGNETAFIASAIWSVASLLTFLRIIQGGLMWRQTGT